MSANCGFQARAGKAQGSQARRGPHQKWGLPHISLMYSHTKINLWHRVTLEGSVGLPSQAAFSHSVM